LLTGTRTEKNPTPEIESTEEEMKPGKVEKAILENKLYEVGDKNATGGSSRVTIAGNVTDAKPGSRFRALRFMLRNYPLVRLPINTVTIPSACQKGAHINYTEHWMRDTKRQLAVYGEGKMNIELSGEVMT